MKDIYPTNSVVKQDSLKQSRLPCISRKLGFLGLFFSITTIPMVILTDKLWMDGTSIICIIWLGMTAVFASSGLACEMIGRCRYSKAIQPINEAKPSPSCILVNLSCYLALLLNIIAIPSFVHARISHPVSSCIITLRQIDLAKKHWAADWKKKASETPAWEDLVGPGKYMSQVPVCVAGGTYTLGTAATHPKCSISGHTLP